MPVRQLNSNGIRSWSLQTGFQSPTWICLPRRRHLWKEVVFFFLPTCSHTDRWHCGSIGPMAPAWCCWQTLQTKWALKTGLLELWLSAASTMTREVSSLLVRPFRSRSFGVLRSQPDLIKPASSRSSSNSDYHYYYTKLLLQLQLQIQMQYTTLPCTTLITLHYTTLI